MAHRNLGFSPWGNQVMNSRLAIFQQYCDEIQNEIPFWWKAFVWCVFTVGFFLTAYFLGWWYTPLMMLVLVFIFKNARTSKRVE
jgi:hypothetical protein